MAEVRISLKTEVWWTFCGTTLAQGSPLLGQPYGNLAIFGTQSTGITLLVLLSRYWDDVTWVLSAVFIIFTMQTGFGMLESGIVSLKNQAN